MGSAATVLPSHTMPPASQATEGRTARGLSAIRSCYKIFSFRCVAPLEIKLAGNDVDFLRVQSFFWCSSVRLLRSFFAFWLKKTTGAKCRTDEGNDVGRISLLWRESTCYSSLEIKN